MSNVKKSSPRYLLSRLLMRSGICRLLTFKTHGQQLRFYPTDLSAELWYNPDGRASDNRLLKAYLKTGECYVDVGANIGSTVIAGAAAVGSTGRVLAVEPHPRIFRYMVENVELNGLTNVIASNVALAAAPGSASFSDSISDDQNHIESAGQGKLIVELATLDYVAGACSSIAFLKIDVEVYEAQVLGGARETLLKTGAIYIEIADGLLRAYGSSAEEVLKILQAEGFHILKWTHDGMFETMRELPKLFPQIENVLAVRNIDQTRRRLAPVIVVK